MQKSYQPVSWGKYLITFLITAGLFVTVFYVSKTVNEKRVSEMRSIQDKIAIDLLSSETQFSLLNNRSSCTEDGSSILAPEIGQLGERLSFMESQLGTKNVDVVGLKKYYSLLQIKDFLLVGELAEKCAQKPITILYFYSSECTDCERQGYVLTALREKYPDLRVYAFDSDLDLSAIKTLLTIYKVGDIYPSVVIRDKLYAGFQSIEDIERLLPELKKTIEKEGAQKTSVSVE